MLNIKARTLSEEDLKQVSQSLSTQPDPNKSRFARSNDEENFPVFRTPKFGKYMFYIPKHLDVDESGNETLRSDHPYLHRVNDDSKYGTFIRCTRGIVAPGFDGSCPLCDNMNDSWGWYRAKIEECNLRYDGDLATDDSKNAKDIRANLRGQMPISNPVQKFVFPVVVLGMNKTMTALELKDGALDYEIYWLECPPTLWEKIIRAASDAAGLTNPAGGLFLFNYGKEKTASGQENTAANAARDVTVAYRAIETVKGLDAGILENLDRATDEWTPSKAIQMVKSCELFLPEDVDVAIKGILPKYTDEIAKINALIAGGSVPSIESGVNEISPNDVIVEEIN